MLAAEGAAGRLGDRPDRRPLPPPIDWQKLEDWIRVFTADKEWEGIEKCLITARRLGGHDKKLYRSCLNVPFNPSSSIIPGISLILGTWLSCWSGLDGS